MGSIDKTNTLVEHLADLRKRIIIIFVVNIVVAFVCFQYADILIQYIMTLNPGMDLIYLTPSELLMVYIKLAVIGAIVLCLPFSIYEVWLFVSRGLLKEEKKYVLLTLFFGFFFFLAGVLFCYKVVLPITLEFFMKFTLEDVTATISIDSFVSFCNTMLISFGVVFELPVLVFLLSVLGILKPAFMKRSHGVLILIIFIIAAIVTPPDVISQVLLAIPMVILLEISMGVCYLVDKHRLKKQMEATC